MKIFHVYIWRERAGVIGDGPAWCASYGCWMHCCRSLPELLWSLLTEYKSDRHLIV